MARPAGRAILFLAMLWLLPACGSSGASQQAADTGDPALEGPVTVEVENRTNPPVPLTIYLRSGAGRRTLGSVSGGRTGSFEIDIETAGSVRYELVAQRPNGSEFISTPFFVAQNQTVHWRLPSNGLTVNY